MGIRKDSGLQLHSSCNALQEFALLWDQNKTGLLLVQQVTFPEPLLIGTNHHMHKQPTRCALLEMLQPRHLGMTIWPVRVPQILNLAFFQLPIQKKKKKNPPLHLLPNTSQSLTSVILMRIKMLFTSTISGVHVIAFTSTREQNYASPITGRQSNKALKCSIKVQNVK